MWTRFRPRRRLEFVGPSTHALYPADSGDAPGLLQKADAAMYRAKAQGKGRYAWAAEEALVPLRGNLSARGS